MRQEAGRGGGRDRAFGVTEDRERLTAETADLLYHLLVVLKARDVTLADVEKVLAERESMSGVEEKASRKGT